MTVWQAQLLSLGGRAVADRRLRRTYSAQVHDTTTNYNNNNYSITNIPTVQQPPSPSLGGRAAADRRLRRTYSAQVRDT